MADTYEIEERPVKLHYYQFDFNKKTEKYEGMRKIYYTGYSVINKPISLLLNLNKIHHDPMDHDTLLQDLVDKYHEQRRNNKNKENSARDDTTLDNFVSNHRILTDFLYVGMEADGYNNKELNKNVEAEIKRQNTFFEKFWRPKGINRPPHSHYCNCTYGKDERRSIRDNKYIFNPFNYRLVIIGSTCIDHFNIRPKCTKCQEGITLNVAIKFNMMCRECSKPNCIVCGDVMKDRSREICTTCKKLGKNFFKSGKYERQSFMFVFITDKSYMLNMKKLNEDINNKSKLSKFCERITLN